MALTKHDRVVEKIDTNRYRAVEVWQCPKGEADMHEAALWSTVLDGYGGGIFPPWVTKVRVQKNRPNPAKAIITVYYESLNWDAYIARSAAEGESKGVLLIAASIGGALPNTDRDGNVISGRDWTDATGRKIWEIVRGKLTIPCPRAMYCVHAAVAYGSMMNVHACAQKIGYVSSTSMSHFGKFGSAGESMLVDVHSQPRAGNVFVKMVDFHFMCLEGGWSNSQLSRQFSWKVMRQPIYDVETPEVASSSFANTLMLVPTDTTRSPNIFADFNFSWINSLCDWTGA